MTVDRFTADRVDRWTRLDDLVGKAKRRPERLGPEQVRQLGALYRSAAADLAVARRRFPSDPVVARLEILVAKARNLVYDASSTRGSFRHFVTTGYWRRVRERPAILFVALALLFLPAVLCLVWALRDPGAAAGLVPGEFRSVTEPRQGGSLGFTAGDSALFSAQIFTNNIRVAFLAFAGGATLGLLTVFVLVYNGAAVLGVILGLAFGSGNGKPLVELIVAHGVLELSCIAVAGMAGLRMAWAVIDPGPRRRGVSFREEAKAAIEVAFGTALCLVVAGFVEGFVTPAGFGLVINTVVGVTLGAAYWAMVILRGGPDPSG